MMIIHASPPAAPAAAARSMRRQPMARMMLVIGLMTIGAGIDLALADNTPQTLPLSQNWVDTSMITVDDNWSGVPGFIGYRGDGLTANTGTDPQTILADGTTTPVDVIANQTDTNLLNTGGVAEFHITNAVVALNGSGTADAPFIVLNLDTTGITSIIRLRYIARDLDASADNAVQPIALHYRIGSTGDFTNVPTGFVADATEPNAAGLETFRNVFLPLACTNQPLVQVRFMTTNAVGSDEWVAIDDIVAYACMADINNNNSVEVTDLLAVINGWGNCPQPCPPRCAADIDPLSGGNCAVNVTDLLAVINAWGPCP